MCVFFPKPSVKGETKGCRVFAQKGDGGRPACGGSAAEDVEAVQSARWSCPRWP